MKNMSKSIWTLVVLISIIILGIYMRAAKRVDIQEVSSNDQPEGHTGVMAAFQQALDEQIPIRKEMFDLTDLEIERMIVPHIAKFMKRTIDIIRKMQGREITVDDILAAISPNVEKILLRIRDDIVRDVKKLQEER